MYYYIECILLLLKFLLLIKIIIITITIIIIIITITIIIIIINPSLTKFWSKGKLKLKPPKGNYIY